MTDTAETRLPVQREALQQCPYCRPRVAQFRGMLTDAQRAIEQLRLEADAIKAFIDRELHTAEQALRCRPELHEPPDRRLQELPGAFRAAPSPPLPKRARIPGGRTRDIDNEKPAVTVRPGRQVSRPGPGVFGAVACRQARTGPGRSSVQISRYSGSRPGRWCRCGGGWPAQVWRWVRGVSGAEALVPA